MISLIPISDANPTKRFPFVTLSLIAANILAFVRTPGLGLDLEGARFFFEQAPIPCQLQETCPVGVLLSPGDPGVLIPGRGLGSFVIAVFISTFLHAGLIHILGNMLFLWVFGNNIEDFLGHTKFFLFYALGGLAAGFAHAVTHLDSVLPTVGASGAVAAVMGAYMVLFPRARVNVLVPIIVIFTVVQMSAIAVLGIWFVYQFIIGAQELAGPSGIAWMAHVGGFVFGAIAIWVLGGRPHQPQPIWQPQWR